MTSGQKPILIFDGTCVLCDAFFQWIVKKDKFQTFSFATLQSDFGKKIVLDHKLKTDVDSVILYQDGNIFIYSEAALKVFILLGGSIKWLGILGLLFPKMIRDGVYRFIANHRYTWFGEKECMIPDKELKKRFI